MDFNNFKENEFIKKIRNNPKWTVSTKDKMPIDIMALYREQTFRGATFENGNQPLADLELVSTIIPKAPNVAYKLDQITDHFVVLDVEPKCPPDIRDELLKLPYIYCELSMSGYGFHMVFDTPITQYQGIVIGKPAMKHERKWYEILLNHYVTFTGNIVIPSDECLRMRKDISEFQKIFEDLAKEQEIRVARQVDISDMPEIENIPYSEDIIERLLEQPYSKTVDDFHGDYSNYEFGVGGYYHKRMNMLISTGIYEDHTFTDKEKIMILYTLMVETIPYRPKHDETREGMPLLMYDAKRIIAFVPKS